MMNKMIAMLLAMLVALMGCAFAETTEPAAAMDGSGDAELAEGADSDWYMAVLTDPEITAAYPWHCFADVNGNGVPVLIVSTTEDDFIGAEDHARIYVYDAGAPKLVMEIGGNGGERLYCNGDAHTLTHFSRFSGEGHIEVYEVENGALVPVTRVDSYGPFHGPEGDNADPVYYQDDAEISEAECTALFDRYAADEDVLTYEGLEIANPWTEMTREALCKVSGFAFGVPDGAEDVIYHWLESDGLAEMQFTLDGDEYCARAQSVALEDGELMNIAGMYFAWEGEEDVTVGQCHGSLGLAQTGSEEWVELCQWYDAAAERMYALSVYTTDPDGLDLTAVAQMVYEA